MRRRPVRDSAGVLPVEVAGGPQHPAWAGGDSSGRLEEDVAWVRWVEAGSAWSRANGHSWNGWWSLLPDEVQRQVRVHQRRRGRHRER